MNAQIKMKTEITKTALQDIEKLAELAKLTFAETFASDNKEEDMVKYLEDQFSNKKLKAELMDPNVQFYFAVLDKRIIGYLKVNVGQSQTEIKDETALEIERIYVLKEFHGKKVGQLLFKKAMEIANEKNLAYLWLGVWEKNPRAIRFYEKNGFSVFQKHIFKLGNDEQTDLMMKLKLK